MSTNVNNLLPLFEERFHAFIELYKKMKAENEILRQNVKEKDNALKEAKKDIEDLKAKYENLHTARELAVNDSEFHNARQRINKLVREVETCIELLKE